MYQLILIFPNHLSTCQLFYFFRTEAFIKISIEAPMIPPSRDLLTKYCTVYTLCLKATTLMTILRLILHHKPSAIQSI